MWSSLEILTMTALSSSTKLSNCARRISFPPVTTVTDALVLEPVPLQVARGSVRRRPRARSLQRSPTSGARCDGNPRPSVCRWGFGGDAAAPEPLRLVHEVIGAPDEGRGVVARLVRRGADA